MKNIYKGKSILVAGGTGMVGLPLTKLLYDLGAKIHVASLDNPTKDQKNMLKSFIKAT